MGALPKRKISTRRKGKRRKAIKITRKNLIRCPHCGATKLTHQVCRECGKA
ncbi:50S ribosomal protein L32 [Patescibacteria group bacterium]|nr:50S ribosomal protein L32 [Patescibacteria group bacterium]